MLFVGGHGDEARTTDHRSIHLRSILIADPQRRPVRVDAPLRNGIRRILGALWGQKKVGTDQLLRRSVR